MEDIDMSAKKLNEQNFEQEVLNQDLALVDFYADWCGPCKMMAPIIDAIANERQDITIGKVNVDEDIALANAFGISSIPALFVVKNGKVTSQTVGVVPKEKILRMLEE